MANHRALTIQSGVFKQIVNADSLVVGAGVTTLAGGLTLTSATAAVSVTGTLGVSGIATFAALINANGNIDRASGTLAIGGTTAGAVTLSKVGSLTTVLGDFQVDGAETIVGNSTFEDDATFEGDVTFGNAATDNVRFFSGIGDATYPDFNFAKELDHVIRVSNSTVGDGGDLTVRSGLGAAGSLGGSLYLESGSTSGSADAGSVWITAGNAATGAGGLVNISGGNSTVAGNGGDVIIDGGAQTSGTPGVVAIGTAISANVAIGRSTGTTTVTGNLTQLTGAVSLTGNAASSLTTSAGALTLTSAAAATWSTSAGALAVTSAAALTLTAAAASTWSTTAGNLAIDSAAVLDLGVTNATAVNIGHLGVTTTLTGDIVSNGDIIPLGTHDLGSLADPWDVIYANSMDVAGTLSLTFTVNTDAVGGTDEDPALVLKGGNGATLDVTTFRQDSASANKESFVFRTDAGTEVAMTFGIGNPASAAASLFPVLSFNGTNAGSVVKTATLTWNATQERLDFQSTGNLNTGLQIYGLLQPDLSNPDLIFKKGVNHTLYVQQETSASIGSDLTLRGGNAGPGGDYKGGSAYAVGGTGGSTDGVGGDAFLRGGFGTGAGTDGFVYVGDANTEEVFLGSTGKFTTVVTGATLRTTGTGMIDLPSTFKIATVSTTANVSAANLNTLTAGPASDASALHTHTGLAASTLAMTKTAGEALVAGNVIALQDDAGTPSAYKADADGTGQLPYAVGFVTAAVSAAANATVYIAGEVPVADAVWDALPAVTDVGMTVYMSETVGNVTLTAPTTSGSTVQKVGVVSVGGTGAVKVLIQIGDRIVLA